MVMQYTSCARIERSRSNREWLLVGGISRGSDSISFLYIYISSRGKKRWRAFLPCRLQHLILEILQRRVNTQSKIIDSREEATKRDLNIDDWRYNKHSLLLSKNYKISRYFSFVSLYILRICSITVIF